MEKNFTTTATIGKSENGNYFHNFGIRPMIASLYGCKPEDIINVKCTISIDQSTEKHNAPDYWGWYDLKEKCWSTGSLIQPSFVQFKMCFIYGYESEEERGKGKAYRLDIEEIK
jgi:hypothetical protein